MMRQELAERVETVFDEAYMWPLGIAAVLLVVEGLVPEAPLPHAGFGLVGGAALQIKAGGAGPSRRKKKLGAKKEKAK